MDGTKRIFDAHTALVLTLGMRPILVFRCMAAWDMSKNRCCTIARDVRVTAIYEGTNGIQVDGFARTKLMMERAYALDEMQATIEAA